MRRSLLSASFLFSFVLGILPLQGLAQNHDIRRDLIAPLTHFEEGEEKPIAEFLTQELELVDSPSHSKLEFLFIDKKPVFRLSYDLVALQNPKLFLLDVVFFGCIRSPGCLELNGIEIEAQGLLETYGPKSTLLGMAELFYNSQQKNPSAQARLQRWRVSVAEQIQVSDTFERDFPGTRRYLNQSLNIEKIALLDLIERAKNIESAHLTAFREANRQTTSKLAELLLNNDRMGVATYLETVLPWETMQATEFNTWKTWIESIRHPNLNNSVLVFRGTSSREKPLFKTDENGKVIRALLAPYLNRDFSKIDEKMLHISERRLALGDRERPLMNNLNSETVIRTCDWMASHSEADNGLSMFLSTSVDFFTSESFVSGSDRFPGEPGNLIAMRIDKRRAFPNVATGYAKEFELLAPLFVFPDEIIAYSEAYDFSLEHQQAFLRKINLNIENADAPMEPFINGGFWKKGFEFLDSIFKPNN